MNFHLCSNPISSKSPSLSAGIQQSRDSVKLCCSVGWLQRVGTSLISAIPSDTAKTSSRQIIYVSTCTACAWGMKHADSLWGLRGRGFLRYAEGCGVGQWVTGCAWDRKQAMAEPETSGEESDSLPLIWLISLSQSCPCIICILAVSCSWT